jgi:hypothetical protein
MAFMLDWSSDVRVGACFIQGAAKLHPAEKHETAKKKKPQ